MEHNHRSLGRELELFDTSPIVGAGLPLWLPAGAVLPRLLCSAGPAPPGWRSRPVSCDRGGVPAPRSRVARSRARPLWTRTALGYDYQFTGDHPDRRI